MKKRFIITLISLILFISTNAFAQDYKRAYSGEVDSLNHLVNGSANAHEMFANYLDNLVEYDCYGVLKPALAESWTCSPDGTVWTFKIKKNNKWYTWQQKEYAEVTAQDWVDAAKYILTKENASKVATPLTSVIVGADEYFDGKITDFNRVGVKATGKYTLVYTLKEPLPYFLSMLTYVTYLPANGKFIAEQGSKFGRDHKTILSNGAYIMTAFEPNVERVLTKNKKYWDQKNIKINRVIFRFNKEALTLGPTMFERRETSFTEIPTSILDSWMKDPAKKDVIHPAKLSTYTYFYGLNFKPTFAAEYEPENWKIAVNNINFRKSLYYGFDRKAAMLTTDPFSPQRRLQTTITPRGYVNAGGIDYVANSSLITIANSESFNQENAKTYAAKAKRELAAAGAKFPIKIMLPYNSSTSDNANKAQVVEQSLERVLGKDYIDVIPVSFPPSGFLNATRRSGNYAMQELNWGPDYADPQTYTDPFVTGNNYNFIFLATDNISGSTTKYDKLVDKAKAETTNLKERYKLFAEAEAFLINQAYVIPYAVGGGGYEASLLEPFTAPYAPFGICTYKFKGQKLLKKSLSTEEYQTQERTWKRNVENALKKSSK